MNPEHLEQTLSSSRDWFWTPILWLILASWFAQFLQRSISSADPIFLWQSSWCFTQDWSRRTGLKHLESSERAQAPKNWGSSEAALPRRLWTFCPARDPWTQKLVRSPETASPALLVHFSSSTVWGGESTSRLHPASPSEGGGEGREFVINNNQPLMVAFVAGVKAAAARAENSTGRRQAAVSQAGRQ